LHSTAWNCSEPSDDDIAEAALAVDKEAMTAERVTNCYDLMDAVYCSSAIFWIFGTSDLRSGMSWGNAD
jgi:hypothetical protein